MLSAIAGWLRATAHSIILSHSLQFVEKLLKTRILVRQINGFVTSHVKKYRTICVLVFPPARSIVEQVNVVQGIIDEPDDDCEVNNGPTSAGEIEAVADRASPTHTMASDVSFPEHSSQGEYEDKY